MNMTCFIKLAGKIKEVKFKNDLDLKLTIKKILTIFEKKFYKITLMLNF